MKELSQINKTEYELMDQHNSISIFLYHCNHYQYHLDQLIKYATITLNCEPILTGTGNHLASISNFIPSEKKFLYDTWDKATTAQSKGEYYKSLIDWIISIFSKIDDAVVITVLLRCYIANDITRIDLSKQIGISDNTLNKRIRSKISKTITQIDINRYNQIQNSRMHSKSIG